MICFNLERPCTGILFSANIFCLLQMNSILGLLSLFSRMMRKFWKNPRKRRKERMNSMTCLMNLAGTDMMTIMMMKGTMMMVWQRKRKRERVISPTKTRARRKKKTREGAMNTRFCSSQNQSLQPCFLRFCLQEHGREKKKNKRKRGAEECETTSEEIQVLSDGEAAEYGVKPAWFIPQENVKKCFELQKFSEASFRNLFGFIVVSNLTVLLFQLVLQPFLILHGGVQW